MTEPIANQSNASEVVRALVMTDSGPIETDPEVREVIGQAILTSIICTHQDDDWPGSFCPTCWESTQRIGEALVRALPQLQIQSPAESGQFVIDGRAAYVRATSALSQLVILTNTEGAGVAVEKTLGALQSAVADLGVAVS